MDRDIRSETSKKAPVRLAVIGYGATGHGHARLAEMNGLARVTAIADTRPADQLDLPDGATLHSDWRRVMDDPNVDAISICLPHNLHAEVTIAALRAGKHVLLEKPIAATLAESRDIVAEAQRHPRQKLMLEMTHRFHPPIGTARKFVSEGKVGKILAVEDRIMQRRAEHLVPWVLRKEIAGGGVALTNGIHMLDRIMWVCGRRLKFHAGVVGFAQGFNDTEDTASMQLSLEGEGSPPVSFLAQWTRGGGLMDDELTIYGTAGTFRAWAWRGWRFEPLDGSPNQDLTQYAPMMVFGDRGSIGMRASIEAFLKCVAEDMPTPVPAEEVLAAQEIVDQLYRYAGVQ